MKLKKSLIAFAGCAALLGSTLTYAQPATQNNSRAPMAAPQAPAPAQTSGPAALAQQLGLSEEQTSQIQQIQEDSAQAVQDIVMDEDLMEARKDLAEEVLDADASTGDIKDKVDEVSDIQEKISFEMAMSRHAAFMVLTEEQQDQFKALLKERMESVQASMMAAQAPAPAPEAAPQDGPDDGPDDGPQGDVPPAPPADQ
jgi:Spy/CpxP family protein refolding chaperone